MKSFHKTTYEIFLRKIKKSQPGIDPGSSRSEDACFTEAPIDASEVGVVPGEMLERILEQSLK